MNKQLAEDKSGIEHDFQVKREELVQELNMSNVTLTAMERVLEEIKSLNEQINQDKQERNLLEDNINETQFERTRMEQKVSTMKNR